MGFCGSPGIGCGLRVSDSLSLGSCSSIGCSLGSNCVLFGLRVVNGERWGPVQVVQGGVENDWNRLGISGLELKLELIDLVLFLLKLELLDLRSLLRYRVEKLLVLILAIRVCDRNNCRCVIDNKGRCVLDSNCV